MKKMLAAGLALVMTLSLCVPALAAEDPAPTDTVVESPDPTTGLYAAKTDVTGNITVPTIKVTVPTTGNVMVNPYQMKYTLNSKDYTDQIVSIPQLIVNESSVGVSVNATVTGKVEADSGAVFATAPLKGTETTKSLFMYLEAISGEDLTVSSEGAITEAKWAGEFNTKATNMIVVNKTAATKTGIVTMDPKTESVTKTYAAFHLAGGAASKPAQAWTSKDIVSVGIAFTFNPVMNTVTPPSA